MGIASAGGLKAGTFVNVDFSQPSNQKALQIPRLALVECIKNPYVYVINANVDRILARFTRKQGANVREVGVAEVG